MYNKVSHLKLVWVQWWASVQLQLFDAYYSRPAAKVVNNPFTGCKEELDYKKCISEHSTFDTYVQVQNPLPYTDAMVTRLNQVCFITNWSYKQRLRNS